MSFPSLRLGGVAGLLVGMSLIVPSQSAAQQGLIDCSPSGYSSNCHVQLTAEQTRATIHFRPAVPNLTEVTPVYRVSRPPWDGAVVVAKEENADFYSYTWSGAPATTDTIRLLVQTNSFGTLSSDTIVLLPPRAPAYRVEVPTYASYVWLRDSWHPLTIQPEITSAMGGRMTAETCNRIRVAFQPHGGGTAQPDTGSARWIASEDRCVAETRWKFSDATGPQQLRVTVGDGERIARSEQILTGHARQEPRIVAGIAFFTRHHTHAVKYCQTPDTDQDGCREIRFETDTLRVEFPNRDENEIEPFFGVEFPIFLHYQPSTPWISAFSRRTRLVGGSTFDRAADNLFMGVTVIPIFLPPYERIPVQLQAGWRWRGGFVMGGSVDGTALVTGALKALGAPL